MKKYLFSSMLFPFFMSFFISIFFIPIISNPNISFTYNGMDVSYKANSSYEWPLPGYNNITSPFGFREAPTKGASTYHGGIDIGAPENAKIVSIASGNVISTAWDNTGGYTIIVEHSNNIKSSYSHVSPEFIVKIGQNVTKGQVIGEVGPKYIDAEKRVTNGATTGTHLHLSISVNNVKINPTDMLINDS